MIIDVDKNEEGYSVTAKFVHGYDVVYGHGNTLELAIEDLLDSYKKSIQSIVYEKTNIDIDEAL